MLANLFTTRGLGPWKGFDGKGLNAGTRVTGIYRNG